LDWPGTTQSGDGGMGMRRSGGRVAGGDPAVRGIALIVVLWTLLLLSLVTAGFLTLARTEVRVARNACGMLPAPRRWRMPGCIAAFRACGFRSPDNSGNTRPA